MLVDLIDVLEEKVTYGPPAERVEIRNIKTDSRRVEQGDVFVAVRGTSVDGHDFVGEAIAAGAVAVVTDAKVGACGSVNVVVGDTSRALARLAARYFGDPSDEVFLCGITGTNGKTSTAHMYRSIIEESGLGSMGIVGTLGHGVGGDLEKTPHTTPGPVELHTLFRKMVDEGCNGVVMEVSSHAVRQHRVWGLDFNIGILTNVTHDHLDYHKTIEDYRAAKREFCDSLTASGRRRPAGKLVYSRDDDVARLIGEGFDGEAIGVSVADAGTAGAADVVASDVEATLGGTSFTLRIAGEGDIRVNMRLLGTFCAANAVLAAGGALATGVGIEAIKAGLEGLARIPGRFEAIGGAGKPVVIIDYSHTPDSMERVLRTCRELEPGRLVTVFGCGGDRDSSKRPLMGRVAQKISDHVYVTMDNPRTERVETIIADILSGVDASAGGVEVETDRGAAIHRAIDRAGADDVVALLGKGIEEYQIVGDERVPFSDRNEAGDALAHWRAR